jgi:hypothetical protein
MRTGTDPNSETPCSLVFRTVHSLLSSESCTLSSEPLRICAKCCVCHYTPLPPLPAPFPMLQRSVLGGIFLWNSLKLHLKSFRWAEVYRTCSGHCVKTLRTGETISAFATIRQWRDFLWTACMWVGSRQARAASPLLTYGASCALWFSAVEGKGGGIPQLISATAEEDYKNFIKKLHGLSPRTNHTDRATAACRRSYCQLLRIECATWSAWLIPTAVFSVF